MMDEDFLRDAVQTNPDNLEAEMLRVPADLAYVNSLYVEAHREALQAKAEVERVESVVYLNNRNAYSNQGVKVTEKTLESLVMTDPVYQGVRSRYINAEVEEERLKGLARAIAAKKDMLVSIGSRINAELRADPMAAAQAREDRIAKRYREETLDGDQ